MEVENLNEIIRALKGAEVVAPVRETFHGTREISVKDPGGQIVTFAQFVGAALKSDRQTLRRESG